MSKPRDGAARGAHHELEELLGTVAARMRVRDGLYATSAALTCAAVVLVVGRVAGFTPLGDVAVHPGRGSLGRDRGPHVERAATNGARLGGSRRAVQPVSSKPDRHR